MRIFLVKIFLLAVTALAAWQLVTRYAEYRYCINERRHSSQSYIDDAQEIRETCAELHLYFP